MRRVIFVFCFSLIALYMHAAPIDGIRIESDEFYMVVLIDGKAVCTPTLSCFIANLSSGRYLIEVYKANPSHYRGRIDERDLLYRERFFYDSFSLKEIVIRSDHPNSNPVYRENIMAPEVFEQFLRSVKAKHFDDDRNNLVSTALLTTNFTSEQCLQLAKIYSMPHHKVALLKMLYPGVVDKQNFFRVVETLVFSMHRDEVNEFIKRYHQR